MRVVRIITRLNIGGPSIQAIELTVRLTARGYQTVLVHGTLGDGEGDMRYLLEGRAPAKDAIIEVSALRRPVAPVDDLRATAQLFGILRRIRPAVVHTHMAKAGAIGRLAALAYNKTVGRGARARVVHTYHGHVLEGYFSPAKTRLFIAAERRLAGVTDRIIAISPRIRDELVQEYRIGRPDQYRVVPLGFDLDPLAAVDDRARAAAKASLHIPPDVTVVTTVGRLTAIKEQRLFLEVAQRVARLHAGVVFLIVGDGELRMPLEIAAASLGVIDRVRFLGWRRDLATVYGATDIFLLTSRNEGTPVALIEALAAGCVGVSTNVGGVADVMPTSDIGLLAPPDDADRLADHVSCLVADPRRRRSMGDAGRRFVVERYGIDRLVTDIDSLYTDLLT